MPTKPNLTICKQKENSFNTPFISYRLLKRLFTKIETVLFNQKTTTNKSFFKRLYTLKVHHQLPPEQCYSNIYNKIKLYQIDLAKKN